MNYDAWFPTCIWWDEVKIDNKKIKECALEMEKTFPDRTVSNHGGWQSQSLPLDKPELSEMFTSVNLKINEISHQMRLNVNLRMGSSWCNINRKGHLNFIHNHPGCFLSVVYYASVPDDSSKITFHDPRVERKFSEDPNIYSDFNHTNFYDCSYTPKEGLIVAFPSWLYHEVEPNKSDDTRISFAFNYVLDL